MNLVCIDAMIAIWGIKKKADNGQEHCVPLATQLLTDLDKAKKRILMPAPIITELLAPVDNEQDRQHLVTAFNLLCRTAVFDTIAAVQTAKIWNDNKDRWKDLYKDGEPPTRIRFKYDLMILGTAVVNKVECLYTGDKNLANMAKQYINAKYIFDPANAVGLQYPLGITTSLRPTPPTSPTV